MGGSSKGFVLVFGYFFEMGVIGVCSLLMGRSWERPERVDGRTMSTRSEGVWSTATRGTFFLALGRDGSTELREFVKASLILRSGGPSVLRHSEGGDKEGKQEKGKDLTGMLWRADFGNRRNPR